MNDIKYEVIIDGVTYNVDIAGFRVIMRFLSNYINLRQSTHWDGREMAHHDCAIYKLDKAREKIRWLENQLDRMIDAKSN